MKNILKNSLYTTVVLTLLFSNLIFSVQAAQEKKDTLTIETPKEENKLKICHIPPGNVDNAHTIEIGENALDKHLEHGDYLGECKPVITPVPISYPESSPFPGIEMPASEPVSVSDEALNTKHEILKSPTQQATVQGITAAVEVSYDEALTSVAVPVYRFFNILGTPRHFYTVNEGERNGLIADESDEWRYEGIAFFAWIDTINKNQQCNSDKVAVHRFYSQSKGNHMFTIDETEVTNTKANPDYVYEGVKFCVFFNNTKTGLNPVYRFWHTVNDKHFFTISEVEKEGLISRYVADGSIPESENVSHWNYEGLKFFAIPPQVYGKYYLDKHPYESGVQSNGSELCGSYKYDVYVLYSLVGYYIYSPYFNTNFGVGITNDFLNTYVNKSGDFCANLGLPIMNRDIEAGISPKGTGGEYQGFERGGIYYSKYGTYSVYGEIYQIYEWGNTPGGTRSSYGFPKGEIFKDTLRGNLCQWFEGGKICTEGGLGTGADGNHGASTDIQKLFYAKEDATFSEFDRVDGPNGEIHPFCGGWIADYESVEYLNESEGGKAWLVTNKWNNKVFVMNEAIGEIYWNNGGCEFFGLPYTDLSILDEGLFAHNQDFDKGSIYRYYSSGDWVHFILNETVREEYYKEGGTFGGWGLPISNVITNQQSCGISGYRFKFERAEVQVADLVYSIKPTIYEKYKDEGGFGKFGFARTNEDRRVDGFIGEEIYGQKFANGYIDYYHTTFLSMPQTDYGWQNNLECWLNYNNERDISYSKLQSMSLFEDYFGDFSWEPLISVYKGLNNLFNLGEISHTTNNLDESEYLDQLSKLLEEYRADANTREFQLYLMKPLLEEKGLGEDIKGSYSMIEFTMEQIDRYEQILNLAKNDPYYLENSSYTLFRLDYEISRIEYNLSALRDFIFGYGTLDLIGGTINAVINNPDDFARGVLERCTQNNDNGVNFCVSAGISTLKFWEIIPTLTSLIKDPGLYKDMMIMIEAQSLWKTELYSFVDENGDTAYYRDFARDANGNLIQNSNADRAYAAGGFVTDMIVSGMVSAGAFIVIDRSISFTSSTINWVSHYFSLEGLAARYGLNFERLIHVLKPNANDYTSGLHVWDEAIELASRDSSFKMQIIQEAGVDKVGKAIVEDVYRGTINSNKTYFPTNWSVDDIAASAKYANENKHLLNNVVYRLDGSLDKGEIVFKNINIRVFFNSNNQPTSWFPIL